MIAWRILSSPPVALVKGELHELLRFWTRYQRPGIGLECETSKIPFAHHVLHRLALSEAFDAIAHPLDELVRRLATRREFKLRPRR